MVSKVAFSWCAVLLSVLFLTPSLSLAQPEIHPIKLDQLIKEVLQNNPEISAAKNRSEVYREKISQSDASCPIRLMLCLPPFKRYYNFDNQD